MLGSDKVHIEDVLEYFPLIDLPATLSSESIVDISKTNKALPLACLQYMLNVWKLELDEFTEYVPCFQLPRGEFHYSLIYWKGSLKAHEFYIITIQTKSEEIIAHKLIAGTKWVDDKIMESVATILEDQTIQIMTGARGIKQEYNPLQSQAYYMEVQPSGFVITLQEEEPLSWVEKRKNTKTKN